LSNLKHTKIGKISFILALILLTYFIITTMSDIMNPISFSSEETSRISNISKGKGIEMQRELLIMTAMSISSFILGVIARFQKESKKILPAIAIIISGVFLIPVINGLVKSILL